MEDGEGKRGVLITVMVAEGAFKAALPRPGIADEGGIAFRDERERLSCGSVEADLGALKKGSQEQLRDVFWKRRDCAEDEGRGAAQEDRYGKILSERFAFGEVMSAAFCNLPMEAGCGLIEPLDPVHTEVRAFSRWRFCVDEGEGEESAAIARPACDEWDLGEFWLQTVVGDRSFRGLFCSDLKEGSMAP